MKHSQSTESFTKNSLIFAPKKRETFWTSSQHLFVNTISSLGVVFGDLGTSPLYVYSSVFIRKPSEEDILGAMCLIFYTFALIVVLKYITVIMNYDKNDQGGIFAMISLFKVFAPNWIGLLKKAILTTLSILGCAFICGDGVITPAISVLSALEGITVVAPSLHSAVVALAVIILLLLFFVQSFGTGSLGFVFGPIILLWMMILGSCGIYNLVLHADSNVWRFFNPYYGYKFFEHNGTDSLRMLGGVVLCITGVEAMYADIGHFGKAGVRVALLAVVGPSVLLCYAGQAAYLINHPEGYSSVFYNALPQYVPVFWGVTVVATLATVIASQAMITGTFSLLSQAMTLGYFPKLKVKHTSAHHVGQIYIPMVNYIIMAATIIIVLAFQSSAALASAYGISVTTVLCIDSVLVSWLNYERSWYWKGKDEVAWYNFWLIRLVVIASILGLCLPVELVYLAANYIKIVSGGWVSLLIGACTACVMFMWTIGLYCLRRNTKPQRSFLELTDDLEHKKYTKLDGIGIYLNQKKFEEMTLDEDTVPEYFDRMIERLNAVHDRHIFVTLKFYPIPKFQETEKYDYEHIGQLITLVTIRYGYYEKIQHLTDSLRSLEKHVGHDIPELHESTHYYSEKRRISANRRSWFFIRYPVTLFSLLFNNTRNGDHAHVHVPNDKLFEYGIKLVLPASNRENPEGSSTHASSGEESNESIPKLKDVESAMKIELKDVNVAPQIDENGVNVGKDELRPQSIPKFNIERPPIDLRGVENQQTPLPQSEYLSPQDNQVEWKPDLIDPLTYPLGIELPIFQPVVQPPDPVQDHIQEQRVDTTAEETYVDATAPEVININLDETQDEEKK
jgi:KUP system potassium uptake protein